MNQRLPSGPFSMSCGSLLPLIPLENSVITPAGRDAADLAGVRLVNQSAPSGPFVMPVGPLASDVDAGTR